MRKRTTERIKIPHETAQMILRRVEDFLRACSYDDNVLESLMMSCYLQGMIDGTQVAAHRPEVLRLLWEDASPPEKL